MPVSATLERGSQSTAIDPPADPRSAEAEHQIGSWACAIATAGPDQDSPPAR